MAKLDRTALDLQMTAAIMDRLASRTGYQNWINEHIVLFDGSNGFYRDVIDLARRIVTFELEDGETSAASLYHFADAASNWVFNKLTSEPPPAWFDEVQAHIPIEFGR